MGIRAIKPDCPACAGTGKIPRGAYLRQLREGLGLSQKQMAARAKVTPQYICDIESEKRRATPEIRRAYGEL